MSPSISARARRIHDAALVIDLHVDTAERILDEGIDWGRRLADGQYDLPRMREGGIDAQFFACWVEPRFLDRPLGRAMDLAGALTLAVARHSDQIEPARSAADVRRIVASGRRAAVLCVEGGHAIEDDLSKLRILFDLGARYLTLTWNNHSNWADACRGAPRHHGLTDFGREVIREMNRLGMIVDVSHASEETFRDAIETSAAPVIASHSNARALCDHPRNLTDEQLAAIARKGGVIGVNFYAGFLSPEYRRAAAAADPALDAAEKTWPPEVAGDPARRRAAKERCWNELMAGVPRPGLEVVLRHIDHIARVAGVDAVAVGSDFDGAFGMPDGLDDCSRMPALTAGLLERGYSESDVVKILGGNVLRVMERVIGG